MKQDKYCFEFEAGDGRFVTYTFSSEDATVDEVLRQVKNFLLAVSYCPESIDTYLDVE